MYFVWLQFYSLSGYIGIAFVLMMLKLFDAFVAMTVTSARKAVTVVLSFLLFPKPFTIWQASALAVFFLGIYLHIYHKNKDEINRLLQEWGWRSGTLPT